MSKVRDEACSGRRGGPTWRSAVAVALVLGTAVFAPGPSARAQPTLHDVLGLMTRNEINRPTVEWLLTIEGDPYGEALRAFLVEFARAEGFEVHSVTLGMPLSATLFRGTDILISAFATFGTDRFIVWAYEPVSNDTFRKMVSVLADRLEAAWPDVEVEYRDDAGAPAP
ncbi:MAG: hypothetical protein KIT43_10720 [Bauldia sp.]|nr:hypothetical protein [Bauldia sp.]MCW5717684.1 hypothetical protein [Bauldia sp.]